MLTVSQSVFKIKKIEYFHSNLDKSYDKNDVIFSKKNTLIWDIHFFCNWIQNVIELQEADTVKISLSECFWEIALQWYMHELSSELKLEMRHDNSVKMWCDELIKCFKMNFSAALDKLYAVKYIIDDAWNQCELIDHVQAIIQYEKSALLNEENQLIFIWKKLDSQLCWDVKISKNNIIVAEFIQILNDIKQIWFDFYHFQSKSDYSRAAFSKQNQIKLCLQSQYQSILYFQSYLISVYSQQTAWLSEDYNSYWKNKIN